MRKEKIINSSRRSLLSLLGAIPVATLAKTEVDTTLTTPKPRRVRFALFADNPYSDPAERQVSAAMRRASEGSEFFIHVGDIKGGGESCDDGLLSRRLALFKQSPRPLILTPGDNEWTDCHRIVAGGFDPLERLQWLRAAAFDREASLGRSPMPLKSQSAGQLLPSPLDVQSIDQQGLPENQAWQAGPCQFVSLSVTGSGHGFWAGIDARIIAAQARANQRWLTEALESAIQHKLGALVIACHAEFKPSALSANDLALDHQNRANPYAWLRAVLHKTVVQFPGTVILLNGDTHTFTLDQPWADMVEDETDKALPSYGVERSMRRRRMARFTRVRGIGSPAASGFVQIEIVESDNPRVPLDITVTPRLI